MLFWSIHYSGIIKYKHTNSKSLAACNNNHFNQQYVTLTSHDLILLHVYLESGLHINCVPDFIIF